MTKGSWVQDSLEDKVRDCLLYVSKRKKRQRDYQNKLENKSQLCSPKKAHFKYIKSHIDVK